ncbi:hypothetical protein YC2023_033349 [Brassica napus]
MVDGFLREIEGGSELLKSTGKKDELYCVGCSVVYGPVKFNEISLTEKKKKKINTYIYIQKYTIIVSMSSSTARVPPPHSPPAPAQRRGTT